METSRISAEFPFESKYIDVKGVSMHYIDTGEGEPVLFLHGNPTSSYLWRNILPHLSPHARCIAPDLVGFGKSGKPDMGYRVLEHYEYVEGFVEKLGLRNITLVLHDWGSALGFHYARLHEGNVRALAFMEAILKTYGWEDFPAGFRTGFRLFRTPVVGWLLIGWLNVFVKQIVPKAIVRPLGEKEKAAYSAPFPSVRDRKPLWVFPNEIPIEGRPADVAKMVEGYNRWLRETGLPKLLFHAQPGGIIDARGVEWCRERLRNLETVDIGPGIHYLQEDNPALIGRELARWYRGLAAV